MKKIAVSQRILENQSYYEVRETLDVKWGEFFSALGVLPIILPLEVNAIDYFNEIGIDGVVFTGGNNLSLVSGNELDSRRDEFENSIIKYCVSNGIPLMGICRGMQVIANYYHANILPVENHVGNRHKLIISSESRMENILAEIKDVNSYHDYGIKETPKEFVQSAYCEADGTVEAMESDNLKIYCQMWHPERERPINEMDLKLFRKFFNI